MRASRVQVGMGVAALAVALAVLAIGAPGIRRPRAAFPTPETTVPAPAPAPEASVGARVPPTPTRADADLETIRDIFHYGASAPARRVAPAAPGPGDAATTVEPSPAAVRLVGLVRRGERLLAALSLDGDVVLVGEGESFLGHEVLDVSEEAVLVREPGGEEKVLLLR